MPHSSQNGFTIIETLVAITILMIALVGPLTIAHKGLLAATYARDQVTASFLAQDALEFVKNVRDTNMTEGSSWLYGLGCIAEQEKKPENYCVVDTLAGNPAIPTGITSGIPAQDGGVVVPCTDSRCLLYTHSQEAVPRGYDHNSTNGRSSGFYRYFYIYQKANNPAEAKIVVLVSWKAGAIDNQILFENEIFDVLR